MASKESSKEHLDDARQTIDSLRQVIVSQRRKWREGMITRTSVATTANAELDTYIAKLYKESEVLEHMINRIENDLEKVGALSHPGPGNWPELDVARSISRVDLDEEVIATAVQDWYRESHQENKDD